MPSNPNWTDWEDQELRRLVEEHGPKKWSLIASKLKSKGSKQCRRRWKNYLNADLKQGGWSPEEDKILLDGHKKYGNKWTEIAKMVGGRTDNAVKNRWAALCKRNQRTARGTTGTTAARTRKRHADTFDSDDDSMDSPGSSTPPKASPRFNTRARDKGLGHQQQVMHNNALYASAAAMSMAATAMTNNAGRGALGKRSGSNGGMEQPAKRHQSAGGAGVGPALDLRSPKGTRTDIMGRFGSGVSSPRLAGRDASPNGGASSHRSRASGSSHLTSISPPGRKGKPELTLLIPNAAADPPAAPPPAGGLEIHVIKDLLSPAEVRYARELNEMEIPLQIALEDPLEPPLSTSRRAAQDALTMLVAPSPTGMGMGPMSLYGTSEYGNTGPASTTSDLNELLKWFQHNFTPRSARQAVGGGPSTSRGVWASPGAWAGAGMANASPRPTTRAAARLATPRGADGTASGWESGAKGTPHSGGSGGQSGLVDASGLHDGHRQLLSKLLSQAKTGMEDLQAHITSASAPPSRMSPRLNGRLPQPWNMPVNNAPTQQQPMLTGAQAAAAIASLPMPGIGPASTTGKRTRHGNAITGGLAPAAAPSTARPHPGPTGGLALSSLGGLLSPMPGIGPLSSRGNGWAGLDVVLTPAISQQDLNTLLELLTADE